MSVKAEGPNGRAKILIERSKRRAAHLCAGVIVLDEVFRVGLRALANVFDRAAAR